jgi:hypothetical protein
MNRVSAFYDYLLSVVVVISVGLYLLALALAVYFLFYLRH